MRFPSLIHKDSVRLTLAFLFAFCPIMIFPASIPWIRLNFFTPFLIILFYKKSLHTSLWCAFFCGLLLDLLSSQHHLGLYALNYCVTTLLIYPQKRNFFVDSLSTLPVITMLFSIISTPIQILLHSIFEQKMSLTFSFFVTDFLLLPLADAFYAFVIFTMPALFLPRVPKHEYFMTKHASLSHT